MTGFGDLNLKFPLTLAISVFINTLNFMLSRVEHGKSFIMSNINYQSRLDNDTL